MRYLLDPKKRCYYNLEFAFGEVPNRLVPYDYDALAHYPGQVVAVVTNIRTGKAEYFEIPPYEKHWETTIASCSLPVLFPPVKLGKQYYLDGGLADPVPYKKAREEGCDKIIVILTRKRDYIKERERGTALVNYIYQKYPKVVELMNRRAESYNRLTRELLAEEKKGNLFLIAPRDTYGVSRTEGDWKLLDGCTRKVLMWPGSRWTRCGRIWRRKCGIEKQFDVSAEGWFAKMEILFIRHGKTRGNLERRYVGRTDEPLLAEEEKRLESSEYRRFCPDVIYTSALLRCRQTAALLFSGKTEDPERIMTGQMPGNRRYTDDSERTVVCPGLNETDFGMFEYKNYAELNGDPAYQAWIDSGGRAEIPGGESGSRFRNAAEKHFWTVWRTQKNAGQNGRPLWCTAGRLWRCWRRSAGRSGIFTAGR